MMHTVSPLVIDAHKARDEYAHRLDKDGRLHIPTSFVPVCDNLNVYGHEWRRCEATRVETDLVR
jgi:hypothetical protein